jgi:hypothetical protein
MTIPLNFMNIYMLVRWISFKLERCARVSFIWCLSKGKTNCKKREFGGNEAFKIISGMR